jgi:adenylosuccinate lyase
MIDRYSRPEMQALWTDAARYGTWLRVEVAVCEVLAERGVIPAASLAVIRERAGFDVARIAEIEREVKHDVIAFTTSVAEHVGPDSRFIHYGLTSSDVIDTALALQIRAAGDLLLADCDAALAALRRITSGRSASTAAERSAMMVCGPPWALANAFGSTLPCET